MTDATDRNPTTMPPLPPPDLADFFVQLPPPWKIAAVELAQRILAAAYRADVVAAADAVAGDADRGAVEGMTIAEYVDDVVDGHERVTDWRKALLCLAYSTNAPLGAPALREDLPPPKWHALEVVKDSAGETMSVDVCAELERRGYTLRPEYP